MMSTLEKLWHDRKHRLVKNYYDPYDIDNDSLCNHPLGIEKVDWEVFIKSKNNIDFKERISHSIIVVHIIVMFMCILWITLLSVMNLYIVLLFYVVGD